MDIEKPKPLDISELNFVDDEDLQESLARSRRIATKKTIKKLTPEQIAKNRMSNALIGGKCNISSYRLYSPSYIHFQFHSC